MYSYEDRIRAVELYIKLGRRVRPTIRQLGYPTKNSLKGWYNEYQQKLDLPAGYAGRRPKFSKEQKAAAIEHYLAHDRCIAATMRALGYPCRGTLTAWIREVTLPRFHVQQEVGNFKGTEKRNERRQTAQEAVHRGIQGRSCQACRLGRWA